MPFAIGAAFCAAHWTTVALCSAAAAGMSVFCINSRRTLVFRLRISFSLCSFVKWEQNSTDIKEYQKVSLLLCPNPLSTTVTVSDPVSARNSLRKWELQAMPASKIFYVCVPETDAAARVVNKNKARIKEIRIMQQRRRRFVEVS